MTVKNQKLCKASKIGRKIEIWSAIESLSRKVNDHANQKIYKYTGKQDALLNEIEFGTNKPKT